MTVPSVAPATSRTAHPAAAAAAAPARAAAGTGAGRCSESPGAERVRRAQYDEVERCEQRTVRAKDGVSKGWSEQGMERGEGWSEQGIA